MQKTTLVILAHPESRSFNGCWADASSRSSDNAGRKVLYSDLVGQGFNPVESQDCYQLEPSGIDVAVSRSKFDPLKAQESAASNNRLPDDVAAEMRKIQLADTLIFHFPLWWFGPPAILKGWFDRCLVHGAMHSVEQRFDNGLCTGKKALFCVTTGASDAECSPAGKEGDVNMLLWPLAYTLRYLGFTVLQHEVVHGVHGYFEGSEETALQQRLGNVLESHSDLIKTLDSRPTIAFNNDTEFDEQGILKAGSVSHSAFIRQQT